MSRTSALSKVAVFGLLGALGCLAGAIAGEAMFWATGSPGAATDAVAIAKPPKEPARLATIAKPAPPPPPPPPPLPRSKAEASPPPPGLGDRLKEFKAAEGYIEITLIWDDFTDLDLHCIDPFGERIYVLKKKAPRSGGELDVDKNRTTVDGDNRSKRPIEHIYWKDKKAPTGRYEVYVVKFADHEDGKPTPFTVHVKIGDAHWTSPVMTIGEAERKFVHKFDVPPKPSLAMTAAPTLVVDQGGSNSLPVRVGRANFEGPVAIKVEGELNEIAATEATVPAGSGEAEASIAVSAREFAAGGPRRLKVVARGSGVEASCPVEVEVRELLAAFRLSAPPEIAVPRRGDVALKVVVARDHYAGAVKVRCEGDVEGLECPAVTLDADRNEVEFRFAAGDEAALGVRKLKLSATGGRAKATAPLALTVEAGAPKAPPRRPWIDVEQSAAWTALLALGLSLSLTAGQDRYLGRSPFSRRTLTASVGGLLAGAAAGGGARFLVELLSLRSVTGSWLKGVSVLGWLVLGWLLGRGAGLIIPNLKSGRAAVAGVVGGGFGASAFLTTSALLAGAAHGPASSRFAGAAILGLAIGSMIALAEVVFRKDWLEVRFGAGEVRFVTLGDAPVSVGGDGRACVVWTPSAPPMALTYTLRDGRVSCTDGVTGRSSPALPGDTRKAGSLEIVARRSGAAEAPTSYPPRRPVLRPPAPAPAPAPAPRPAKIPTPAPTPRLRPAPPSPAFVSEPAPPTAASPIPDDDDATRTTAPPADACPSCGRSVPGAAAVRYCLICDLTF